MHNDDVRKFVAGIDHGETEHAEPHLAKESQPASCCHMAKEDSIKRFRSRCGFALRQLRKEAPEVASRCQAEVRGIQALLRGEKVPYERRDRRDGSGQMVAGALCKAQAAQSARAHAGVDNLYVEHFCISSDAGGEGTAFEQDTGWVSMASRLEAIEERLANLVLANHGAVDLEKCTGAKAHETNNETVELGKDKEVTDPEAYKKAVEHERNRETTGRKENKEAADTEQNMEVEDHEKSKNAAGHAKHKEAAELETQEAVELERNTEATSHEKKEEVTKEAADFEKSREATELEEQLAVVREKNEDAAEFEQSKKVAVHGKNSQAAEHAKSKKAAEFAKQRGTESETGMEAADHEKQDAADIEKDKEAMEHKKNKEAAGHEKQTAAERESNTEGSELGKGKKEAEGKSRQATEHEKDKTAAEREERHAAEHEKNNELADVRRTRVDILQEYREEQELEAAIEEFKRGGRPPLQSRERFQDAAGRRKGWLLQSRQENSVDIAEAASKQDLIFCCYEWAKNERKLDELQLFMASEVDGDPGRDKALQACLAKMEIRKKPRKLVAKTPDVESAHPWSRTLAKQMGDIEERLHQAL